jgi:FkbM family methyltransferase
MKIIASYNLNDLLIKYVNDPESDVNNFYLAIYYDSIGQKASAISYYLRTAERSDSKKMQYQCLLAAAKCFESQGTRNFTVKSLLQNALTTDPQRPEAYYFLSHFYAIEESHYESYLIASIGEKVAKKDSEPLDLNLDYPGFYSLLLKKAEAAYPCGLCDESRKLFFKLKNEYVSDMSEKDKNYLQDKLSSLGAHGSTYQFRTYNSNDYENLRFKFNGSENIQNNHSQVFQDMFVLSMLDGKRNGTYLEIGGGYAYHKNNTALLERDFEWKGVSIEFNEHCVNDYKTNRPNANVLHTDALLLNYSRLLKQYFSDQDTIDYLQLDIEPSANTYEALLSIPFNEYKFGVITYEHDHYVDVSGSYRDKSREYLTKMGYELVVTNVAEDDESAFEDWWVHPDLVDRSIINVMKATDESVKNAGKYMLCGDTIAIAQESEAKDEWEWQWGEIGQLEWFKHSIVEEIFDNDIYQKHFRVNEGDVVLDIGASCGPFTYKILDQKPSKVYCFEPHKGLFETMKHNLQGKDNVVLINKALANVDSHFVTAGLFDITCTETWEKENVAEGIRFDTFLRENDIQQVDFIKIDAEGGEYDLFSEENLPWVIKNVKKVVGEWHLSNDYLKNKFREFRDKVLVHFDKTKIHAYECVTENEISELIWDERIFYYREIIMYIDNSAEPEKFWDMTPWPTMEFTTSIPKKGCVVDCVYCPQRILEKSYIDEERYLTLDNFKRAVDKLPQNVRVTFAGFTEPWLNKDCTDMVLYAQERGHPIAVFTTGIGMKVDDVYRIKNVPYDLGPNGRFVLHLPDNERRAKHPITKNYIEVLEAFKQVHHEIQGFYTMAMGTVHDEVKHLFPEAVVPAFWSRAGNLVGEAMLKPELLNLQSEYKSIYHGEEPRTCGCDEHLYHNIMLPNGDVSLCCMDYNLKFIIGNLLDQSYEEIAPKPQSCFDMCRFCENGVKPV